MSAREECAVIRNALVPVLEVVSAEAANGVDPAANDALSALDRITSALNRIDGGATTDTATLAIDDLAILLTIAGDDRREWDMSLEHEIERARQRHGVSRTTAVAIAKRYVAALANVNRANANAAVEPVPTTERSPT